MKNARQVKRSLFITQDIKAGELLTAEHVRSVRPGHGMSPKYLDQVIGKRISYNMQKDDKIMLSDCFTHEQLKIMKNIRRNATNALLETGIPIEDGTKFEISAHYGLENFDKT